MSTPRYEKSVLMTVPHFGTKITCTGEYILINQTASALKWRDLNICIIYLRAVQEHTITDTF